MKRQSKIQRQENIGLLYILPWIVGFLVLQLYPLLASLYYSFCDYDIVSSPTWTGLTNYIRIFTTDTNFWKSTKATFIYVFVMVPCKLAFALFVAMLLNYKIKGIGVFRTLYYLPSILGGSVSVSIVWKMIFRGDGILNTMLKSIGIPAVPWLTSTHLAILMVCLLGVWQFGSSMVIFLAALKNVPGYLYEAARVEGCSPARAFFKITIPMITPMILFNVIMQMINAFQDFTGPFIITYGGPLESTYVYAMKLYDEAFKFFKMGYASALSWLLFIIIVILALVIFGTSSKWVFYSDGGDS